MKRPDFTERRITSEDIFSGGIIRVSVDTVSLPDGTSARREVARHPGAAVIVPLTDDEEVVLAWQFRYPLGRHLLELPAGKLEKGEEPQVTAARELLEETGYRAREWESLLEMETSPGFCDERAYVFVARGLVYEGHPGEAGEFVSVEKIPLTRALEMIFSGELTDAKTVAGLLYWSGLRR